VPWNGLDHWQLNRALPDFIKIWHSLLLQFGSAKDARLWKRSYDQTQDGRRCPNRHILKSNNSAADCSISHNFGPDFNYVTVKTQQTFKVKGSKVMRHMFKIIRSNRPEIEIWQIFDLYIKHPNKVIQNLDCKLGNSSLCACEVDIWPKNSPERLAPCGSTSGGLHVAMHRNCQCHMCTDLHA